MEFGIIWCILVDSHSPYSIVFELEYLNHLKAFERCITAWSWNSIGTIIFANHMVRQAQSLIASFSSKFLYESQNAAGRARWARIEI